MMKILTMDGGEYEINEIGEEDSLGTSGSVSRKSVSNGSDSSSSDSNKLISSEWCDDRKIWWSSRNSGCADGGVSGMAIGRAQWEVWRDNQVPHEDQGKIRRCFLQ